MTLRRTMVCGLIHACEHAFLHRRSDIGRWRENGSDFAVRSRLTSLLQQLPGQPPLQQSARSIQRRQNHVA